MAQLCTANILVPECRMFLLLLVSMRILTKPGPYLPGHPISSGLRRVPSFSNNKDPLFRLLSFIVISCSLSSLHSWTPQDHPRFLTLSLIVSCPFAHSPKSNPAFSLPYWHYYKVLAFLLKNIYSKQTHHVLLKHHFAMYQPIPDASYLQDKVFSFASISTVWVKLPSCLLFQWVSSSEVHLACCDTTLTFRCLHLAWLLWPSTSTLLNINAIV